MPIEIPAVVIDRLPVYARALNYLEEQGRDVVSSQELGNVLGVTPAQIRKDLSYFGRFGKQGRGYNVRRLALELRQILGLDRQWSMILIGVGHLGQAILTYDGFQPQGFVIVDAFDADPSVVGKTIGGLVVQPIDDLRAYLEKRPVDIGIVAVPAPCCRADHRRPDRRRRAQSSSTTQRPRCRCRSASRSRTSTRCSRCRA